MEFRVAPTRNDVAAGYNTAMNTSDDHEPPTSKRQVEESDIGPEPDWLIDDTTSDFDAPAQPLTAEFAPVVIEASPVLETKSGPQEHPWLWGLVPLVFVFVVGLIAWFSTYQALNGTTIWRELSKLNPALLPARWTMLMWWVLLPLLGAHLALAIIPAGREPARIKLTGPLITATMIGAAIWMLAQIWHWHLAGLIAIAIATGLLAVCYLFAIRADRTHHQWRQSLAVIALGANTAFSTLLLAITWQSHWHQPFGTRGTGVLITLALVIVAAVLALFFKEGIYPLVLAIWFLGVAQHQWAHDKTMSLSAIVALIFTVILAGLGNILAMESRRDSGIASPPQNRTRTSFFRRSQNPPT